MHLANIVAVTANRDMYTVAATVIPIFFLAAIVDIVSATTRGLRSMLYIVAGWVVTVVLAVSLIWGEAFCLYAIGASNKAIASTGASAPVEIVVTIMVLTFLAAILKVAGSAARKSSEDLERARKELASAESELRRANAALDSARQVGPDALHETPSAGSQSQTGTPFTVDADPLSQNVPGSS